MKIITPDSCSGPKRPESPVGTYKTLVLAVLCRNSLILLGMLGPLRVQLIPLPIKQRLRTCAPDWYVRREGSGSPEGIRQSVLEIFDAVQHA